jgi:GNAT superfamily N-acetyltransferase
MTFDKHVTFTLPSGVHIRAWAETDFSAIQRLSSAEGWTTVITRPDDARAAWRTSWPALVAVADGAVIGFVRALTDGAVTCYVADLLVAPAWRGQGLGAALLDACHQLFPTVRFDLLSLDDAAGFYEAQEFRPLRGFRKSYM